jgi:hypothetical protein
LDSDSNIPTEKAVKSYVDNTVGISIDNETVANSDSGAGLVWTLDNTPTIGTEHIYGFAGTQGVPTIGQANVRLILGVDYTISGAVITTFVSMVSLIADYKY